jgi:hypothetical protein
MMSFSQPKPCSEARRISIGKALSEMARRGMQTRRRRVSKSGFVTFGSSDASRPFGPAEVQATMDVEGMEIAAQFLARK